MVTLALPALMSTPMPPGSLLLPIVPPLIATVAELLSRSMPSPVMPLSETVLAVKEPATPAS